MKRIKYFLYDSILIFSACWIYVVINQPETSIIFWMGVAAQKSIPFILNLVFIAISIIIIFFLKYLIELFSQKMKEKHQAKNYLLTKRLEALKECEKIKKRSYQEKEELLAFVRAKTTELETREQLINDQESRLEIIKIENRKHLTGAENKIKKLQKCLIDALQFICDEVTEKGNKYNWPEKRINRYIQRIKNKKIPELENCNIDIKLNTTNDNYFLKASIKL